MRRSLLLLCLLFAAPAAAQDAGIPLIPRDVLFGNPERTGPKLSPDGKQLAWLAPDDKNVLQVWVRDRSAEGRRQHVTADKKRGIRQYFWAEDTKHAALPAGRRRRRELPRLRGRLATKNVRDLTPSQGVRAAVRRDLDRSMPERVLVTLNVRDNASRSTSTASRSTPARRCSTPRTPATSLGWVRRHATAWCARRIAVDARKAAPRCACATRRRRVEDAHHRRPRRALQLVDFTEDGKSIIIELRSTPTPRALVEKTSRPARNTSRRQRRARRRRRR